MTRRRWGLSFDTGLAQSGAEQRCPESSDSARLKLMLQLSSITPHGCDFPLRRGVSPMLSVDGGDAWGALPMLDHPSAERTDSYRRTTCHKSPAQYTHNTSQHALLPSPSRMPQ
jgi:hypothetical protein